MHTLKFKTVTNSYLFNKEITLHILNYKHHITQTQESFELVSFYFFLLAK